MHRQQTLPEVHPFSGAPHCAHRRDGSAAELMTFFSVLPGKTRCVTRFLTLPAHDADGAIRRPRQLGFPPCWKSRRTAVHGIVAADLSNILRISSARLNRTWPE